MERLDPIDIEFLINNAEVKADANRVKDSIRGIGNQAERTQTKVNSTASGLNRAGNAAAAAGNQAGRSRAQWNGLGNSVNQLTREIPAFTYSAQTGFLALSNNIPILADEIGRLKAENDALVASGKKGVPVWKQVVKGLLSWQTALSLGVAVLTILGPQIIDYLSGLFNSKKALKEAELAQKAFNKALEASDYKNAIKNINELRSNIDLAKEGIIDQSVVVEKYNELIGDTAGKAKTLADVEAGMAKNAEPYIKATLAKAVAMEALEKATQKTIDAEQRRNNLETEDLSFLDQLQLGATGLTGSLLGDDIDWMGASESAKKAGDEIQEEADSLVEIYEKNIAEAQKYFKKLNKTVFGDGEDTDEAKKILNDRKSLLQKIADLDKEYARKQLDRDEEELQALRDKFSKVRKLIEEFNAKKPNKAISLDGFTALQSDAEASLIYTQDTRSLKSELERQKELYREIEEYRATFGVQKTRERYGEQLRAFESYAALLKSKIAENSDAFQAVKTGTATPGQTGRVEFLREQSREEKRIEAEKYNELLAELMSYQQKRNLLIEQYLAKRVKLLADGHDAEAAELERRHKNELSELDDEYAKSTDAYKALIKGVEGLSETAARAVIANARKMVEALVAAGRISAEAAADINAKIADLEKTVDGGVSGKLGKIAGQARQISSAFLELGDSVGYFNEGLGDTLTTMGSLVGVASDAAMSVASFASGNIIGGITSAISAISGIFRIGAKARESERKAKAKLLEINQKIEDGERRINQILRDRKILRAQEIEQTLKGIAAQREALADAAQQNRRESRRLLRELQNENFISGSHTEKYGGFLGIGRKTRVVNEYSSMLGLTFEQIEELFEKGKLNERAAELFEQLRDLKEEGRDINGMLKDLEDQANQVFTGTTSGAIADSIIEGLRQGHDSFEDFAGDIEGLLQNAILNAIKYQTLEEPLKELYEKFAQYAESEGELSEAEAQAIRDQYQKQIQSAIDQYEQWSEVLNEDLLNGQSVETGLQGAIRREMTEETASELTGLFRGQYDITKRHFQLHERHYEVAQRNYDATRSIMQQSALIEQNTANTVVQLQLAVSELKVIGKNTKSSQTARDIGIG